MTDRDVMGVQETADFLEVSASTVYRLIQSGALPASKDPSAKRYQIRRADLIAYVEKVHKAARNRSEKIDNNLGVLQQKAVDPEGTKNTSNNEFAGRDTVTRRQFLKGTLSFVLGFIAASAADFVGSSTATLVYERFANEVNRERKDRSLSGSHVELIDNLFGGLHDFSWSANLTHLVETYGLFEFRRASNMRASTALGSVLGLREDDWLGRALYTSNLPGPVQIDTDVIAIGSPTSDPVAKRNLEYVGPARYHLRRSATSLIDLPITYLLDQDEVGYGDVLAKRFIAGEEREMPNWTLRIGEEVLPPPKLGHDRWLRTDYLLITRMPNLLSRRAFFSGSEVLVVGGTHGTGTEAIELLLHDIELLSDIALKRKGAAYFQAMLPVSEISHDLDGDWMHTKPISLGDPIVFPVTVDVERIVQTWLGGLSQ